MNDTKNKFTFFFLSLSLSLIDGKSRHSKKVFCKALNCLFEALDIIHQKNHAPGHLWTRR